jgi:hypothetical protein
MIRRHRPLALMLGAAILALLSWNAPPLKAGPGSVSTIIVNKADIGAAVLSAEEERLIRSYFDLYPDALGDVRPLSEGVRNKLAPGAPLPLINTRRPLPLAVDARLTPRQGLDYQILGGDIVLFDTVTHRIVAVLKDVRSGG